MRIVLIVVVALVAQALQFSILPRLFGAWIGEWRGVMTWFISLLSYSILMGVARVGSGISILLTAIVAMTWVWWSHLTAARETLLGNSVLGAAPDAIGSSAAGGRSDGSSGPDVPVPAIPRAIDLGGGGALPVGEIARRRLAVADALAELAIACGVRAQAIETWHCSVDDLEVSRADQAALAWLIRVAGIAHAGIPGTSNDMVLHRLLKGLHIGVDTHDMLGPVLRRREGQTEHCVQPSLLLVPSSASRERFDSMVDINSWRVSGAILELIRPYDAGADRSSSRSTRAFVVPACVRCGERPADCVGTQDDTIVGMMCSPCCRHERCRPLRSGDWRLA